MKEENLIRSNLKDALLFASGASFPFFVYAPISIYFSNSEEFDFTFYNLWGYPLVCFFLAVAVFTLLWLIAARVSECVKNAYAGALFALGIACWLQGNFLAEDLGAFNGQPYNWHSSLSHIVSDGLIWLLIFVICIFAAMQGKKVFKALKVASGAFLVFLAGVLLITVCSARKEYFLPPAKYVTDGGMYTVSKEENVIVLVPDMFDEEYFAAIAGDDPETLENFDGFTWFRTATGSYGATNYALGSFLTGQPLLNAGDTYSAMLNTAYGENDLFSSMKENGWSIGIYTSGKFIPEMLAAETDNCLSEAPEILSPLRFTAKLYRLCACSWLPDGLRCIYWMDGTEFDGLTGVKDCESEQYTSSNVTFYEAVSRGLSVTDDPCFRLIHLYGAHYPYLTDENLQPITPSYSDENAVRAAKGTLKAISAYLDELKTEGAYENSLIIIMADHGYSIDGGLTNPVLLVKRPGDSGPLCISDAPVSQWDVLPEIRSETGLTDSAEKAKDLFSITEEDASQRLYYQLYDADRNGLSRLVEYAVQPQGNERKYFCLTDREFTQKGEIISHSAHCAWCLANGTDPVDAPNSMSIVH